MLFLSLKSRRVAAPWSGSTRAASRRSGRRASRLQETVSGVVSWSSSSAVTVSSLQLRAMGIVKPTLDPRTVGIFEALYSSIKPIEIMSTTIDMVPSGKQLPREVQLPFDFPVEALAGRTLTETYHGVYVTVKYMVEVHMATVGSGLLGFSKQYTSDIEFIVEVPVRRPISRSRECGSDSAPAARIRTRRATQAGSACPCPRAENRRGRQSGGMSLSRGRGRIGVSVAGSSHPSAEPHQAQPGARRV